LPTVDNQIDRGNYCLVGALSGHAAVVPPGTDMNSSQLLTYQDSRIVGSIGTCFSGTAGSQ
jgi:hypothetical protein